MRNAFDERAVFGKWNSRKLASPRAHRWANCLRYAIFHGAAMKIYDILNLFHLQFMEYLNYGNIRVKHGVAHPHRMCHMFNGLCENSQAVVRLIGLLHSAFGAHKYCRYRFDIIRWNGGKLSWSEIVSPIELEKSSPQIFSNSSALWYCADLWALGNNAIYVLLVPQFNCF